MVERMRSDYRAVLLLLSAFAASCASTQDVEPVAVDLADALEHYETLSSPKALAAAVGGENWAYGLGRGPTTDSARRSAIENCQVYRMARGIEPRCTVRFVDDTDVWPLSDALAEFVYYPDFKALWIAGTPEWHVFNYVHGVATQEEANRLAIERCRATTRSLAIDGTCRICATGDGVPCTFFEQGWQ